MSIDLTQTTYPLRFPVMDSNTDRKLRRRTLRYAAVELEAMRYAILRESALLACCRRAGIRAVPAEARPGLPAAQAIDATLDRGALASRLRERRLRVGLSQAELARRAGIRAETLNRIERGRTTPDFATIRRLIVAMNAAETRLAPAMRSGSRAR